MNKFFFLMILFGLGSVASIGVLAPELELIAQQVGIFFTDEVGLLGCTCVDFVTGIPVDCQTGEAADPLATEPLCPPLLSP